MAIRTSLTRKPFSPGKAALATLLSATLFAAGPVAAQPAQGPEGGAAQPKAKGDPELRNAQKKMRDLRQQLGKIQQKALDNNPELKKQRSELQELMKSKVKSQVDGADQKMARLKEIRSKLQGDKDIPKAERKKLMQEFQKTAQTFQQAQQKAMQDPEVQKAQKQFRDDMRAAMKKEDPNTDQLIQDLQQARKEFQKKLQDRFSGMGSKKQGGGQQ
jgi:chromosome segregation ATPase